MSSPKNKDYFMRNIVIQISNDARLKNNGIFDANIDPNLSVFLKLKAFLSSQGINLDTPDLRKSGETELAIYLNAPYPWNIRDWRRIVSCKNNILLAVEPEMINPFNYSGLLHIFFNKIYTWNTELAGTKKYFVYNIAQSNFGLDTKAKLFKNKKLLTFVGGNKMLSLPLYLMVKLGIFRGKELYSERIRALDYFEKNIPDDFEFYGKGWNSKKESKKYKTYRGSINNKIETISNYKFALCFENATEMKGYVTEKIFDCLKAKTIPIYLGASDIEKYMPKDCFIDFRDFDGYSELISYLKNMQEEEYDERINNIEKLLLDHEFMHTWFEDGWVEDFSKKLGLIN